jgi:serine O-acetyltransferase
MFKNIIEDLDLYSFRRGWPRFMVVIIPFIYPTTWPVLCYRYQYWVHRNVSIPIIKQLLSIFGYIWKMLVVLLTGVTISERAKIGKGLFISHLSGIVIGNGSCLGNYCSLHQCVTIGGAGIGKDYGKPKIGDYAFISVGAVIAGKINIEDNEAIGANAVVIKDAPSNVSLGVFLLG